MSVALSILFQLGGFLLGGFLLSYGINLLSLRFAKSLGIRNKNDLTVRWSNESKPSLGGISLYFVFLFSGILFAIFYFEDHIFRDKEYLGLLGAASIAFILGITDDTFNTRPLIKLATQILCGVIIALSGTTVDLTSSSTANFALTIVWIVGLMNSLNMLDNMDGITGTVSIFILASCLGANFIILDFNTNFWSVILVAQIGALIGFLRFNVYPSKMFMGDTGSMFLGLFIGFYSIKGLINTSVNEHIPQWVSILITLTAMAPAAIDTITVIINRLRAGKSPMVGGKDHTTHHLVYSGKTDKQVWLIFLLLSVTSGALALLLIYGSKHREPSVAFIGLLFFCVTFYWLYRNTILYKPKEKV